MRKSRVALALVVLLTSCVIVMGEGSVAVAAPSASASATPAKSASPSGSSTVPTGVPSVLQSQLDKQSQEVDSATITDQMQSDATFDLTAAAADATFPLNAADATIEAESTTSDGGTETIRLVADLLFPFGSAELTDAAKAKLPQILADIPKGIAIEINGYTDSIGTDADNLVLSQKRAQAVADVVASSRSDLSVTVHGYGEADPVADNTNPDGSDNSVGRSQNRRVEIVYQK